jgi:hypothetical protein
VNKGLIIAHLKGIRVDLGMNIHEERTQKLRLGKGKFGYEMLKIKLPKSNIKGTANKR